MIYQKQANDFLKKTGTTFSIKFVKNDFFFSSDKEKRDIYEFTLQQKTRKYSAFFGQSLNGSGWKLRNKNTQHFQNYKFLSEFKGTTRKEFQNFIDKTFGHKIGSSDALEIVGPQVPTPYDVLAGMPSVVSEDTFSDFCSNFGYNPDSVSARKIYDNCILERNGLERLFNDDELILLGEIC